MWEISLAGLILLLGALITLRNPLFLSVDNLRDMAMNSSYVALAALGMSFVILSGQIDISVGSGLAVCAALTGLLSKQGWSWEMVLLATTGAGLILGAINGTLASFFNIPPILATLATMSILRGALLKLAGGRWISLSSSFQEFAAQARAPFPYPALIALLLGILCLLYLTKTVTGRSVYAVGGNPDAAARAGVNVPWMRFFCFLISGLFLGLSGFVYTLPFSTVQTNAGMGFELLVITAVVVGGVNIFGGRGSVLGALLGVLLLTEISSSLTYLKISVYWEKALQGILVLVAVTLNTLTRQKGERSE